MQPVVEVGGAAGRTVCRFIVGYWLALLPAQLCNSPLIDQGTGRQLVLRRPPGATRSPPGRRAPGGDLAGLMG